MQGALDSADFRVERLNVIFRVHSETLRVINDVTIVFPYGKTMGIIGESGCGKSVLGQALLGLLPNYADVKGHIFYKDMDILCVPFSKVQPYLGSEWGVIPQSPTEALNPIRNIRKQFNDIGKNAGDRFFSKQELCDILELFGLQDGERILKTYPHELSGGMLQRVLCAMAVCGNPRWVLADEPTKGLDMESSACVRENLQKLRNVKTKSMIVITHDLTLAKSLCDEIVVMYAGEIIEVNDKLWSEPLHPYTQAVLKALPENGFQAMHGRSPGTNILTTGCKFASRCVCAQEKCQQEHPDLYNIDVSRVRCFLYA